MALHRGFVYAQFEQALASSEEIGEPNTNGPSAVAAMRPICRIYSDPIEVAKRCYVVLSLVWGFVMSVLFAFPFTSVRFARYQRRDVDSKIDLFG